MFIRIAALFNSKAKEFIHGRKGIFPRIEKAMEGNTAPILWVHCASLGEFEQGRPIIEAFKKTSPNYKVFLTFFSPSGYTVRKNYPHADYIFYLPTDTKKNAKRLIKLVDPKVAIFVKYEFWYHYTKALKKRGIPLLSTSSIFRPGQLYFKPYGSFYKKILKHFSYFFVQDNGSRELLKSIGIKSAEIVGDTRFDRVKSICDNKKEIDIAARFINGRKTMVVGSCWPEDLEVLTPFINNTDLKFIIAPHEIDERFMAKMENDLMKRVIRYSNCDEENLLNYDILMIDNVGMLSSLYHYGDYAYVGGAFGQGLHNILEPATFGLPVFFGNKNYHKFKEARDLINLGGAFAVRDYNEFKKDHAMVDDRLAYQIASQVNKDYIQNNIGATDKIMRYCSSIIQKS